MQKNLKTLWIIFIVSTLLPLIILLALSLIGYFEQSAGFIVFGVPFSLTPIVLYYYLSNKCISKNELPDETTNSILSITFYLSFIIYMTATLVSFYVIIIGSFLINGEVPMGMDLVSSQVPYLIGGGTYLLLICAGGMYYLAKSKTYIRSEIPKR